MFTLVDVEANHYSRTLVGVFSSFKACSSVEPIAREANFATIRCRPCTPEG